MSPQSIRYSNDGLSNAPFEFQWVILTSYLKILAGEISENKILIKKHHLPSQSICRRPPAPVYTKWKMENNDRFNKKVKNRKKFQPHLNVSKCTALQLSTNIYNSPIYTRALHLISTLPPHSLSPVQIEAAHFPRLKVKLAARESSEKTEITNFLLIPTTTPLSPHPSTSPNKANNYDSSQLH